MRPPPLLLHVFPSFAVGGAQAIAALAYGAGEGPACDIIVGPGNRWVTAAKALVAGSGACGIDMLAGPSECLVLADATGDAALIAADLLAQAEHDTDALPILVTTHAPLVAAALEPRLQIRVHNLPRYLRVHRPGAEADDVRVVMLASKFGQLFRPANGSTNTVVFICGNGNTVCTSTNQNAESRFTRFNRTCNGMSKIWIINR
jgi:histidinol dehydrogenase